MGSSLAWRALVAAALLVGFYILALGTAAGLLWIPYFQWTRWEELDLRLALGCVVMALLILWALLPRWDHQ